jgi:hypothetical protein
MEGNFKPGMQSTVHRHPGTEAWFVLSGAQCIETPRGIQIGRPGAPSVIVPPGDPMLLTGIGTEQGHWLVLILMDAAMPRGLPADDWTPKHICERNWRGQFNGWLSDWSHLAMSEARTQTGDIAVFDKRDSRRTQRHLWQAAAYVVVLGMMSIIVTRD